MNNTKEKAYQTIIIDAWELNKELQEFCTDCLKEIFPDAAGIAINEFNEGVESIEHCGCIQGLNIIHEKIKRHWECKAKANATK